MMCSTIKDRHSAAAVQPHRITAGEAAMAANAGGYENTLPWHQDAALQQLETVKAETMQLQAPGATRLSQPLLLEHASTEDASWLVSPVDAVVSIVCQQQADKKGKLLTSRPSLQLFTCLSSSDSVSFVPVAAPEMSAITPTTSNTEQPAVWHTTDGVTASVSGNLPAAAAAAESPSVPVTQPSTPEAAVASPFAAYSGCAFASSTSSSSDNSTLQTANWVQRGTMSLQCSSSDSLLCSLQLPCAEPAASTSVHDRCHADAGSMVAWPSATASAPGRGSCDMDAYCQRTRSNSSIFSLVNTPTSCKPDRVPDSVMQQEGQLADKTIVFANTAGASTSSSDKAKCSKQKRHGWFYSLNMVLTACFVGCQPTL